MKKYIKLWCESCQIVRDFFAMPNIKSAFLWGIALYILALFALIRADIYYMDDFQHSIIDNSNANVFSRFLMTFILSDLLTFGKGTLDMSPLPQIFGICFVVASSLMLIYLIRRKFDLFGVVASLPLGLSPYFLQNLSYKFDALTMGIALFLAISPFLFQKNMRVFCAVSVVSLLCMLMCYQAANATYIILSLYFAFFANAMNLKQRAGFLGICVANLIIATLIYKLAIMQPISEYIIAYTSNKMFPLDSLFSGVWANLCTYATTIFDDLKSTAFIWLIALNCVLFIVNRKILAFVFLALGFVLSFGLFLVLEQTIFEPRAFYGFNALVAVIFISNISAESSKILRFFGIVIAVITAYFLISFANIYGNALKKQDEYLDFRAKLLLSDLSDAIPKGVMVDLKIYINKHPVAQRFAKKYGDIARLIPKVAENDWFFHWRLRHLNAPYNLENNEICAFLNENFGVELVAKNAYHTIEKSKSCYIVTIH